MGKGHIMKDKVVCVSRAAHRSNAEGRWRT